MRDGGRWEAPAMAAPVPATTGRRLLSGFLALELLWLLLVAVSLTFFIAYVLLYRRLSRADPEVPLSGQRP